MEMCQNIQMSVAKKIGHEFMMPSSPTSLRWRYNERDGVSNHENQDFLLKR